MSFSLENFVAAPSIELLNHAKTNAVLDIADHYALTSVKPFVLKHEIKNILIKFWLLTKFMIRLLRLLFL